MFFLFLKIGAKVKFKLKIINIKIYITQKQLFKH